MTLPGPVRIITVEPISVPEPKPVETPAPPAPAEPVKVPA